MASIQITHRGSYEHYKTRTKVFINWLTEAAHKCCKLDDVVLALKGRAGKTARKNGDEVLLTTREITILCQKVADKKNVKIPDWILGLLRTIIDRRTAAAIFHASASDAEGSDLERSNVGHAHFIYILHQAYDMFAAVDKSRITERSKPVTPSKNPPIDNLFEHLEVEDSFGAQLDEDELEQRAAEPPRIRFRVEVDEKQETLEQLLCLLGDLRKVRLEIEATYKQYVCGELTYDVACMVTSIGFGIIRRTCERFSHQHSEFGDYAYMLKFLGLRMERHEALVVVSPESRDEHDPGLTSIADTVRPTVPFLISTSSLCVSGADTILQFNDELQSSNGDPKAGVRPQQRHGFAQLLHDEIAEIRELKKHPEILVPDLASWYGDDFVSGVLNFAFGEQQGLPIWLAVVTQCYRNIYDIVDGDMKCGAWSETARWDRTRDTMNLVDNFKYCAGEGSSIRLGGDPSSWFDWFRSRNCGSSERTTYLVTSMAEGVKAPCGLITNLPTVTSLMAFPLSLVMYVDGCTIANTNLVVQCAAHLYAACHYSGLTSRDLRWQDMDFFLKHHKMYTETKSEADPYALINHFFLAMGIRGSTLPKARAKPEHVNINMKHVRWVKPSSKLVWKLAHAWKNAQYTRNANLDVSVVDAMLEALAECSTSDMETKSSKSKGKIYTPIELLSVFKQHFIIDEPERNFNMVEFSQQCSTFVEEIRTQASKITRDISSATSPHDLTGSILANSAQLLDEGKPASFTLLSVVSQILEKTIADCGDKYSKDTYERSSGHLPPHQKPELLPPNRQAPSLDIQINQLIRKCLGKARGWVSEDIVCEDVIYQADGTLEWFPRLTKTYNILGDWTRECMSKVVGMPGILSVTMKSHDLGNAAPDHDELASSLAKKVAETVQGDAGIAALLSLASSLSRWVSVGADIRFMPSDLVDVVAMGLEGTKNDASVERAREWLAKLFMGTD